MGFDSSTAVHEENINQIAHAHFPELGAFDEQGGLGDVGMTNLDFMRLDGEEGTWGMGKEWSAGGLGSGDLDGFPVDGGFGMGFDGKF